jgi:hypothetical protein
MLDLQLLVVNLIALNKNKTNSTRAKALLFRILMACSVLALALLVIFYINRGPQNTSTYKGARKVTIQKKNGRYNFYKDGKPFLVKGGAGFTHIKELAACGGNTMICWDTSKLDNTLKEAAQYNVAVIIGLAIPGGDNVAFYNNEKNIAALYNAFSGIVIRYKDRPSLLAWCLGNELPVPFSFTPTPFYKTYNRILDQIHNIDPHHPVSTGIINIAKRRIIMMQWRMPALDFYCINIYNSIKTIQQELNLIKLVWRGPYLIAEWAPNGGWEAPLNVWQAPIENTSTKKAEMFYELFNKYMPVKDPRFLGSMAFYWGSRQEYTYTWFSIFNEDGIPTEIKEALYDCWRDTITQHASPKLQYMLIDSLGAKDNIILTPGSKHNVSVLLQTLRSSDTLQYSWQILKEDWMLYWGKAYNFIKKPPSETGLFADSTLQYTNFRAPSKEGPYRVFVTVYNSRGYCATANIPIYVVE